MTTSVFIALSHEILEPSKELGKLRGFSKETQEDRLRLPHRDIPSKFEVIKAAEARRGINRTRKDGAELKGIEEIRVESSVCTVSDLGSLLNKVLERKKGEGRRQDRPLRNTASDR